MEAFSEISSLRTATSKEHNLGRNSLDAGPADACHEVSPNTLRSFSFGVRTWHASQVRLLKQVHNSTLAKDTERKKVVRRRTTKIVR